MRIVLRTFPFAAYIISLMLLSNSCTKKETADKTGPTVISVTPGINATDIPTNSNNQ